MPRLSPGRATARREQILNAALMCFAEKGFHKSTMQAVAATAGLSIGALYCHFEGKEEMAYAVIEARHAADLVSLERAVQAGSLSEALDILATDFFPSAGGDEDKAWRKLAVQVWAETQHDETLLNIVRDGLARPRQILVDLMTRAQQRGELAGSIEPEPAARVVIAVLQGITLQWSWEEASDPAGVARALKSLLAAPRTDTRSARTPASR